jgi:hypothetical protein
MRGLSSVLLAACCAAGPLAAAADAEECAEVPQATDATKWEKRRAWIHEAGWFQPIEKPKTVAAEGQKYDADAPMLVVQAGGETRIYPVHAMAYHHVANDFIGGEPVVVTY